MQVPFGQWDYPAGELFVAMRAWYMCLIGARFFVWVWDRAMYRKTGCRSEPPSVPTHGFPPAVSSPGRRSSILAVCVLHD